jgi:hypothetical protein
MSGVPPKVTEFLKRACAPGRQPELVKETEWSYVYKLVEKSYWHISTFLADETYKISSSEIRRRWPRMSENERLDFVQNFWSKLNWDENDTQILEMIMEDGNDRLWEHCAQAFLKHPDRDRAVKFLIWRVEQCGTDHDPLKYIQALGISKDARAVPIIRPYFEKYRDEVEKEKAAGVPNDVVFGPIPCSAYFTSAAALLQITGSTEYEHAIQKYLNHENEQVRWWAENALRVEGPTTAKRKADFRKAGAKE